MDQTMLRRPVVPGARPIGVDKVPGDSAAVGEVGVCHWLRGQPGLHQLGHFLGHVLNGFFLSDVVA